MGKTSYRLVALASFLLLLVVWFGLTASGFVDPMFLPGPVDVAEQAWNWATPMTCSAIPASPSTA